ncbi:RICIN domain-containing protein [Kitasatospora sp. NPDC101176]|uniref:RICIN domain-containing protein n=1 Tax=Kitasatospora sp. NPDC101176 TaxID=3364099 RepID=UPI0037FDF07A
MPRPRIARFLAAAGVAALLPLSFAADAHAATYLQTISLMNVTTMKCADLPGYGWNPVDTRVSQYPCRPGRDDNQMWRLERTRTVDGRALYQFANDKSGYCLDLPDYGAAPAGAPVTVYTCASDPATDNQEWYLVDVVGNGGYEIVNYKSGLCLDVAGWAGDGSDRADDLPLTAYPCYDSSWHGGVYEGYDDHIWRFYG